MIHLFVNLFLSCTSNRKHRDWENWNKKNKRSNKICIKIKNLISVRQSRVKSFHSRRWTWHEQSINIISNYWCCQCCSYLSIFFMYRTFVIHHVYKPPCMIIMNGQFDCQSLLNSNKNQNFTHSSNRERKEKKNILMCIYTLNIITRLLMWFMLSHIIFVAQFPIYFFLDVGI